MPAPVLDWRARLENDSGTTWSVTSVPAVSTAASASRAAGAAGVKNVCTQVTFSCNAVAAQTALAVTLRDGATGAGTILMQWWLQSAVGTALSVVIPNLWIVGTAATAMTVETTVANGTLQAPVATNFVTVALTGELQTT